MTVVTWAAYHFGDYFCRNFERCDDNENILNGTTCCHDNQRNFSVPMHTSRNRMCKEIHHIVSPGPAVGHPAAIRDMRSEIVFHSRSRARTHRNINVDFFLPLCSDELGDGGYAWNL